MSGRHINIGLVIEDLLVSKYGFEPAELSKEGWWVRKIDSQHVVIVRVNGWRDGTGRFDRGAVSVGMIFGVVRRDMNEVWRQTLQPDLRPLFPTISEPPSFFGQGRSLNGVDGTAEETAVWVDLWVPRLIEEAPSVRFIENHIAAEQAMRSAEDGGMHAVRMVQALMRGWTVADEAEFISPWLEMIHRLPQDDPARHATEAKLKAIRGWVAEHPDGGGDRELAD